MKTDVILIGAIGTGKSTLARILSTHLYPSAGRVAILGQRFGEANLAELRHSIRLVQAAGPYEAEPSLSAEVRAAFPWRSSAGKPDGYGDLPAAPRPLGRDVRSSVFSRAISAVDTQSA